VPWEISVGTKDVFNCSMIIAFFPSFGGDVK